MDPQPQEPLFDPTSPSTAAAWQAYSQAMIEWQQRQIAKASQDQSSVQTPGQAPSNSGFFGMFKGGRSRRSRRSRKSRKSKRSKSRRR